MTLPAVPVADLNHSFRRIDPVGRLALLRDCVDGTLVFTTSLGLEDQVLLHMIARSGLDIRVATLDTGRLFPETYTLLAETERRYGRRIHVHNPAAEAVEALVARDGINGFYRSKAARAACCAVRKVAPLDRALDGAAGWITGLRADQSAARQDTPFVDLDPVRGIVKANPLLDWTRERVLAFALAHDVPISPLHAQGFRSIGCAPCTRAVGPDEEERAGRWWWEADATKECGLHLDAQGRLVRAEA